MGRDGTFGIIDHSVQIERKLKMISGIDNVYIEPAPDHNTGHPPSQIFDGQPDKILRTTNILYTILSTDNKTLPRLKIFKRMLPPTIANTPPGSAGHTTDKYDWYLYLTALAIVKSIN